MKSVEFEETNMTIAKDQPEYNTLHANYDHANGEVIVCFELTDVEIVELLTTKKLWYKQLTFKNPMHPMMITTKKEDVL